MALAAVLMTSSACSVVGTDADEETSPDGSTPDRVVLVTHDSFALPKKLMKSFEETSGLDLVVRAAGDAGTLTNKLVLTASNPTGDVAFGVDNTFASRAVDAGVFADPEDGSADGDEPLVPIDTGNVCVNIDTAWFADRDLAPPQTLADLTEPAYRDLFVIPGAATSSPGMAFLLSTIAEYGDGWPDYWGELMDNGAKLTSGWSDAYYVDFTQGGGEGDRPIVVSYDSSPAFTLTKDGQASTTEALLDTCFHQVEYAGVLAGADNPTGGQEVVDWLLSAEVQSALPEAMYVFPVAGGVELPRDWAEFAVRPSDPYEVDPDEIAANRKDWLTTWSDVTSR